MLALLADEALDQLAAVGGELAVFQGVLVLLEAVLFAFLEGLERRGVAVSPANPSVLAAYDDLHVFVTRDGGHHWTRIPGFGITPSFNAMAFDPLDDRVLFAGGANGVARLSTDTMELRPEDGDLFNLFVTGFAFDSVAPGTLYVSTLGGGVLKTDLSH